LWQCLADEGLCLHRDDSTELSTAPATCSPTLIAFAAPGGTCAAAPMIAMTSGCCDAQSAALPAYFRDARESFSDVLPKRCAIHCCLSRL
jgi:hypothetical protein